MATPTLTKRMVKNQDTGIDLSVPSIQEVEAPLGGISVEYEVAAVTNLQIFKTQLHKSEDVVHFSVFKAYREIEDLYNKLHKKFPSLNFPPIPKGNIILRSSNEEKQKALDSFMRFIAQNDDICQSAHFIQFIGINPQKYHRSSIADNHDNKEHVIYSEEEKLLKENYQDVKKCTSLSLKEDQVEEKETMSLNSENNTPDDMFTEAEVNIRQDISEEKEVECTNDIFPKMKVVKVQNQQLQNENLSNSYSTPKKLNDDEDDVDLFEEVKLSKENKNKETQLFDSEWKSHHGLFDEIDDGSSNLFASNKISNNQNILNKSLATPKHLFPDKTVKSELSVDDGMYENTVEFPSSKEVVVRQSSKSLKSDDSKNILQDRRPGVSLFQEQDYGESITTDEESLFLVSQNEPKHTNKNLLLASSVLVMDSEIEPKAEIKEDLEDLLKLDPLPKVPVTVEESVQPLIHDQHKNEKIDLSSESAVDYRQKHEKQEQLSKQISDNKQVKDNQEIASKPTADNKAKPRKQELPSKPVPKPRSKITPVVSTVERPEVLPRTVFSSKPALPPKPAPPASKPTLPTSKPTLPASKPTLPTSKPAPPVKPKPPVRKPPVVSQKPSDLPKSDSKSSQESADGLFAENQSADNQPGDLNSLDILQYIEQEEKLFSSEPSLFD